MRLNTPTASFFLFLSFSSIASTETNICDNCTAEKMQGIAKYNTPNMTCGVDNGDLGVLIQGQDFDGGRGGNPICYQVGEDAYTIFVDTVGGHVKKYRTLWVAGYPARALAVEISPNNEDILYGDNLISVVGELRQLSEIYYEDDADFPADGTSGLVNAVSSELFSVTTQNDGGYKQCTSVDPLKYFYDSDIRSMIDDHVMRQLKMQADANGLDRVSDLLRFSQTSGIGVSLGTNSAGANVSWTFLEDPGFFRLRWGGDNNYLTFKWTASGNEISLQAVMSDSRSNNIYLDDLIGETGRQVNFSGYGGNCAFEALQEYLESKDIQLVDSNGYNFGGPFGGRSYSDGNADTLYCIRVYFNYDVCVNHGACETHTQSMRICE